VARMAALLDHAARKLPEAVEVARLLALEAACVYTHEREPSTLKLPTNGRRPALRFDRRAVVGRPSRPADRVLSDRRPATDGRAAGRAGRRRPPAMNDMTLLESAA